MDLFLYFSVYARLSLTGTLSLENRRVKTDECKEKLKVISKSWEPSWCELLLM